MIQLFLRGGCRLRQDLGAVFEVYQLWSATCGADDFKHLAFKNAAAHGAQQGSILNAMNI